MKNVLSQENDDNRSHRRYSLKSDSHLPKKICVICFIESPLKMVKNAFYFILKVFIMTFWPFRKNSLIRNIKLISEFMISQPGQQTIAIHIFPIISRCKDNLKWNLRAERVEISTRYTALKKITIIWKISTWVEIW